MKHTRITLTALALAALSTVTACSSSGGDAATESTTPGAATTSTAAAATDLSGVCPKNVVIQTDWNPQSEQGGLYNLLGPDAKIDAGKKVISGSLYSKGEPTGVSVEIRAGGPAIGFTGVPAQMYTDKDILLGWVNTDESIQNSAKMPTTAVMATFEKRPRG